METSTSQLQTTPTGLSADSNSVKSVVINPSPALTFLEQHFDKLLILLVLVVFVALGQARPADLALGCLLGLVKNLTKEV